MDRLEYFRRMAALGARLPDRAIDVGDLEYFRDTLMRDPDHIRRVLFGANILRRQRLSDVRRSWSRALDVRPDLLSPLAELRYEPSFTRLMAHHLSPHGSSLGPRLLGSFLRLIGVPESARSPEAIHDAKVTPEYVFPEGRVDLHISLPAILVIAELKVDANEGDGQLPRYAAALQRDQGSREGLLVYLTPPDHEGPDDTVDCKHITFDDLLKTWLPFAAGSSDQCNYLARFLKSVALIVGRAGHGTFDDWAFGVQQAALDAIEEIEFNDNC